MTLFDILIKIKVIQKPLMSYTKPELETLEAVLSDKLISIECVTRDLNPESQKFLLLEGQYQEISDLLAVTQKLSTEV